MDSRDIQSSITRFRFQLARVLVIISFVLPFINANYFVAQATFEVNFLPVLLAVVILPEAFIADGISLILLSATMAVAAMWGSTDAVLRVIIGAVPCLFLLNLHEYCLRRGEELIPRSIAYRTLQIFVGFSALQWIHLYIMPLIPRLLTDALTMFIPRYSGLPYDEFGVRGVQGWASEPSGAAMVCFAFAIVAAQQDPKRRLRILALLVVLVMVNKSVYGIASLAILGVIYAFSLEHKRYSVLGVALLLAGFALYLPSSSRVGDFTESAALYGVNPETNLQLFRVAQIIYPLSAFPKIYVPVELAGMDLEPMGLLPLLVGYGSIAGCALYCRLAFFKLPLRHVRSVPLALAALFVLSFVVPADLIPVIIALAYALTPTGEIVPRMTWYDKVMSKARQAYATQ